VDDQQQQQRMNRAAQEFTDALVAAYRTASDNTAVAQQLSARQIEYFFDAVMGNLRAQAGGTSQMARQLASQQRFAQETTRDIARVSTDNYMDLLDSVFSFYQGGASRTQRRADEARGHIEQAEARAEQAERARSEAEARAERAEARAEQAERARSEAEGQAEEAKKNTSVAKRRATEAGKRATEAESRAEEAEARAEQAQEQSQETERRLQEAQRRALEAERARSEAERSRNEAESRAEEAERSRSEAESRAGDEEGDTQADAASQPQSQWVRTSGSSKVRGRDTRARNRSSGRRR
jgi:chromosome segregation ATPase